MQTDDEMICPKCGASQPGDAFDCHACGIIFDRWIAAQRQALASAPPRQRSAPLAPAVEPRQQSRPWLIGIFVAVGLIVGATWVTKNREHEERLRKEMLDRAEGRTAGEYVTGPARGRDKSRQGDVYLTSPRAADLLGQCISQSWMNFSIPKVSASGTHDPLVDRAVSAGLITATSQARVTYYAVGRTSGGVKDDGSSIRLLVEPPKITVGQIHHSARGNEASALVTISFTDPVGHALIGTVGANASFAREFQSWRPVRLTSDGSWNQSMSRC